MIFLVSPSGADGSGPERASQARARLVTTTATPAPTRADPPLPGVSPSSPRPMATLATGVTAEMTGSVISGRPV